MQVVMLSMAAKRKLREVVFDLFGRVDEAFERARQFAADEYSEHFVARFCDAFDNFANLAQRRLLEVGMLSAIS